jgi:hypothetical protein
VIGGLAANEMEMEGVDWLMWGGGPGGEEEGDGEEEEKGGEKGEEDAVGEEGAQAVEGPDRTGTGHGG